MGSSERLLKELRTFSGVVGANNVKLTLNADVISILANGKPSLSGYATIAMKMAENHSLIGDSQDAELQAAIWQWLEARTELYRTISQSRFMQMLNCHLSTNTFVAGNSLTIADILLYFATHSVVSACTCQELCTSYRNIARWFSYVQSDVLVSASEEFPKISVPKSRIYI